MSGQKSPNDGTPEMFQILLLFCAHTQTEHGGVAQHGACARARARVRQIATFPSPVAGLTCIVAPHAPPHQHVLLGLHLLSLGREEKEEAEGEATWVVPYRGPAPPSFLSPKINPRRGVLKLPSLLFWRLLLGTSCARPAVEPHEPSKNSAGCRQTTAALI